MINLLGYGDLHHRELGPYSAKKTTLTPGQVEAASTLWHSDDGNVSVGVWECTPGTFSAVRDTSSEICHLIFGRASLTSVDGFTSTYGPGDMIILPRGWRGEWTIIERARKLYFIYANAPASADGSS
ncbi:MAG: cupin [Microvirga sp.]|nr:cupin [Microvirga sp.]